MKTLLSLFITTLISGCVNQNGLTKETKDEIAGLLEIEPIKQECYYPKLPTFKVPALRRVPKGMSIEEAFKAQNKVNKQLRFICSKYRRVVIETNKRYRSN